MFMKKQNSKKTNLLTRILHDKKGIYVTTAMKIVIALVLGITTLTGTTYVMKDVVIPQTTNKIEEAFDKDYSAEGGGSGGGVGGGAEITRGGTVLEGCTYTSSGGTVYNAGAEMPFAPSVGDVYEEGDYKYKFGLDYYDNSISTWSVAVKNTENSSYGRILSEIAGEPVTNMYCAFAGCSSLVSAPTIPDSVDIIDYAFASCSSLSNAPVIPNGVLSMCGTFIDCSSMTNAPAIPDSVTNMSGAFSYCTSLTAMPEIPNGVTSLNSTFNGCSSLSTISTIPSGVTDLEQTFMDCTSLVAAPPIPSNVTVLTQTFMGCTSLSGTVEVNANPTGYDECFSGTNITEITGSCSSTTKTNLLATK